MKNEYVFRLELATLKSIPDIYGIPGTDLKKANFSRTY
jgi:hypothetical protein